MAVKKRETMNQNNAPTKHTECNAFGSEPCSCTVYDLNSAIPEPFIPEYNITAYSYNMMTGKYEVRFLNMKLAANSSNMAIFEVSSPGGENMSRMVVRGLATDDHQSFMLLHICMGEDPDTEPDIWLLSRSPSLSDYRDPELSRALASNNITIDDMKKVLQSDCVYPPSQMTKNWGVKFIVF